MNITADQFTFTKEHEFLYKAEVKASKMRFYNFSQMKYVIEIYETADNTTQLIANIYDTIDGLDLTLSWDERVKLHKKLEGIA